MSKLGIRPMEGSVQRGTSASSQGGSERHRVKRKRIQKKRPYRAQRGTDASQGDMGGGGSKLHQVKRRRVKKERTSRVQSGRDTSKGKKDQHTEWIEGLNRIYKSLELEIAKVALEFYEKSQGAEFEMVELLYAKRSYLILPGSKGFESWAHVSFTAKPKNADGGEVPTKYFFGELLKDKVSREYSATYCSTFEPSDDPGFSHGCIFCSPGEKKFHPADGYLVGRKPCKVVESICHYMSMSSYLSEQD
ncbi:uncharacterized protein [Euphorbia lathyris]|uniref:uncharacterized protein n=1 Tax=Euphorbia lathyris TaxID=212925 RepID=UPI00331411E9